MIRLLFVILVYAALAVVSLAQEPTDNSMVPNGPGVLIQGSITPGNCAKWVNSFTIADAGAPCGTGGGGCTTNLVGDWSDSTGCNLVFAGH